METYLIRQGIIDVSKEKPIRNLESFGSRSGIGNISFKGKDMGSQTDLEKIVASKKPKKKLDCPHMRKRLIIQKITQKP